MSDATPQNPLAVHPANFGRFTIRSLLGEGAQASVYLADDPVTERVVALKIPQFTDQDPGRRERFVREARAAARLRHPNLVAVFESGLIAGRLFIASEYVAGTRLSVMAQAARSRFDFRQIADWIRQLADALAYAHSEGVIHRDVKTANILIDQSNRPRLMDFGLAKRIEDEATLTTEGNLLGTPAYMSPEQARGDHSQVGPASDQYSLGVIFYELLTGQTPFEGQPHVIIPRILQEQPLRPRARNRAIPCDLDVICLKCLEKEPSKRYGSCQVLARDLQDWQDGGSISARSTPVWERAARWARKRPLIAGLLGTSVVLLLLITSAAIAVSTTLSHDRDMVDELLETAESELQRENDQSQLADEKKSEAQRYSARARELADEAQRLQKDTAEKVEKVKAERNRGTALTEKLAAESEQMSAEKKGRDKFQRKRETQLAEFQQLDPWPRYVRLLQLSDTAIRSGQYGEARRLLELCPESLRAWEWDYLMGSTKEGVESVLQLSSDSGVNDGGKPYSISVGVPYLGKNRGMPGIPMLRFSHDGRRLGWCKWRSTVTARVFDVADGAVVHESTFNPLDPRFPLRSQQAIGGTAFSPDLGRLAVMTSATVWTFNVQTGKQLTRRVGPPQHNYNKIISYYTDGSLMVVANGDRFPVPNSGLDKIWDGLTGRARSELEGIARAIDWSGARVAFTKARVKTIVGYNSAGAVESPAGLEVDSGYTTVLDFGSSESQRFEVGSKDAKSATRYRFSTDGRWLIVSVAGEPSSGLRDLSGRKTLELQGPGIADVSRIGDRVIASTGIWDIAHDELVLAIDDVADAQWSPDGRHLALIGASGLWIMYAPPNPQSLPDKPDVAASPAAADDPDSLPESVRERPVGVVPSEATPTSPPKSQVK